MLQNPGAFANFEALATESQTAGHGRRGRDWYLAPGDGVAISIMVRPQRPDADWLAWLPLLAGVVLVRLLNELFPGIAAELKWPNDVLLSNKKLAGILVEQIPDAAAYVVGVGINTALPTPPAEAPEATSIAIAGFAAQNVVLAERFRDRFAALIFALERGQLSVADCRADIAEVMVTLGQQLRVLFPDGQELYGEAVALGDSGELILRLENGQTQSIVSGDISRVRPSS